jgi:hypothetical protein
VSDVIFVQGAGNIEELDVGLSLCATGSRYNARGLWQIIACSGYIVWVVWGVNFTKILAAFLYHIHVVIDKVEIVKSRESRVSVFRLAQPVGKGDGQQKRNYCSKHGQCVFCGVTVWLGVSVFYLCCGLVSELLFHDLVVSGPSWYWGLLKFCRHLRKHGKGGDDD